MESNTSQTCLSFFTSGNFYLLTRPLDFQLVSSNHDITNFQLNVFAVKMQKWCQHATCYMLAMHSSEPCEPEANFFWTHTISCNHWIFNFKEMILWQKQNQCQYDCKIPGRTWMSRVPICAFMCIYAECASIDQICHLLPFSNHQDSCNTSVSNKFISFTLTPPFHAPSSKDLPQ